MKTLISIFVAGLFLMFASLNSNAQGKSLFTAEGYTELFNGENLTG